MKHLNQYMFESILKINVHYDIIKDGKKYHLILSKDNDNSKGYIAKYIDNDEQTLIEFNAKHINELETKIKTWYRKEGIKMWNRPRNDSYFL